MKYVISMIWPQIVWNGAQNILRTRLAASLSLTLVWLGEIIASAAPTTQLIEAEKVRLTGAHTILFVFYFM